MTPTAPDAGADLPMRVARFSDLTAAELYALLRLRVDVFVVEQRCPYPELDGRDTEPGTVHAWIEDDDGVVAALRILAEAHGVALGRVATRADRRGQGLAARLVAAALERTGSAEVRIGAQAHLEGWYERFGFVRSGPGYLEDGIPHLPMVREPSDAQARTSREAAAMSRAARSPKTTAGPIVEPGPG